MEEMRLEMDEWCVKPTGEMEKGPWAIWWPNTGPALAKDGTQKTEKQKDGKVRLDEKDEDGKVSKKRRNQLS